MILPEGARRARWSVAAIFALNGVATGTFTVRIPSVQARLGLSDGELAVALFMPSIAGAVTLLYASRIMDRFSGRTLARCLLGVWLVCPLLPVVVPNFAALCAALLVYGAVAGLLDVVMNVQGLAVERSLGRPLMSGFHGMWSLGALGGAGLGTASAYAGLGAVAHVGLVMAVLVLVALVAGRSLLPGDAATDARGERGARAALPRGPVLRIGLVGFCAMFVEVGVASWCGVYLSKVTSAAPGTSALAYTLFLLTVAGCRLGGDLVIHRWGAQRTVRLASGVGLVGGVLVIVAPGASATTLGFGLLGAGVALVVPMSIASAGRAGRRSGHSVSGVSTLTYGAGMLAPTVLGAVAAWTNLRVSLLLATCLVVAMGIGSRALRDTTTPTPQVASLSS